MYRRWYLSFTPESSQIDGVIPKLNLPLFLSSHQEFTKNLFYHTTSIYMLSAHMQLQPTTLQAMLARDRTDPAETPLGSMIGFLDDQKTYLYRCQFKKLSIFFLIFMHRHFARKNMWLNSSSYLFNVST